MLSGVAENAFVKRGLMVRLHSVALDLILRAESPWFDFSMVVSRLSGLRRTRRGDTQGLSYSLAPSPPSSARLGEGRHDGRKPRRHPDLDRR